MRIYEDLRLVQGRISVVQSIVVGVNLLLIAYFWHLQVLRGRYFQTLAENNRQRTVSIAAPRGTLLDRHGRLLVENRPSFNVVLTPEQSKDLDSTVARLSALLQMGEPQIRERLARRALPFQPVVIRANASLEEVASVEARHFEIPEVRVEPVSLRSYPLATAAAHTLGRVGEVTERQLQLPDFSNLEPGNLVGQAGLESQYNGNLMGKDGRRVVYVNSRGLEVAEDIEKGQPPTDGPSLTLTLDADLQRVTEEAMGGRAGSAVALDPTTGEILAMTSTPAYDPNLFATGIDAGLWGKLSTDPTTPLINRVIQGQYAAGSLFKLVLATAALEEGVISPSTTFYCPGYLSVYNTVFHCHRASGHGVMDVHRAIAQSCNVFFYQVGIRLEIDRIARYAKMLGLGAPTGIDLPHEQGGLIPDPEWKRRTQKAPWYAGETVSVAIGQGQVTVTPLQMGRLAAALATGRLSRPHLVRAVGGVPLPWEKPTELGLKPETLQIVRSAMSAVVNEQGTGFRCQIPGIEVCGKTGSAQVVAHARLGRVGPPNSTVPHGWFVGFAPADHPRIALAVLVEHGGSGGEAAAPVARQILERFFRTGPATTPTIGTIDTEG